MLHMELLSDKTLSLLTILKEKGLTLADVLAVSTFNADTVYSIYWAHDNVMELFPHDQIPKY